MNNYKDKIWPIAKKVIYVLTVLATAGLLYKVAGLNMLPVKYLVPVILAVVFLLLILFVLFFDVPKKVLDKLSLKEKEKKTVSKMVLRTLAMVLSIALLVVDVVGLHMVNKFEETMTNLLEDDNLKVEEFVIGVYVLAEDKAVNLEDVKRYDLGYSLAYDRNNTQTAIDVMENELGRKLNLEQYSDVFEAVDKLLAGEKDGFILSTSYMDVLIEQEGYEDIMDKIKCIHECVVTVKTEASKVEEGSFDVTKDTFIVYISGHDTTRSSKRANSDVNIVAVVNPTTKQILLINTPRDSYVEISVSPEGELDKLTHCGVYGVECSMDTLNELYDMDIRYYAQLNFTGFMHLVDALGGITVYSEKAFTSTSMNVEIKQGLNHLDGLSALEFVRERKQFGGGDRMRGKHQMAVIKGIIAQMSSGNLLRNYDEILNSMGGYFRTNVPQEVISELVKMQLEDLSEWNVQMYSVTGVGDNKTCYSLRKLSTYVMILDDRTIDHAKTLIQMVYDGETIEEEDLMVPVLGE